MTVYSPGIHGLDPDGRTDVRETYCGYNSETASYPFVDRFDWITCEDCLSIIKENQVKSNQTKFLEMGTVDTETVIKAIESTMGRKIERHQLYASLVVNVRRKNTVIRAAYDIVDQEVYGGRQIEIPSKSVIGVPSDVSRIESETAHGGNKIIFVIDGYATVVDSVTPVYVYPVGVADAPVRQSLADRARRRDEINRERRSLAKPLDIKLARLLEGIENYRGCQIEIMYYGGGVLTDIWTMPGYPDNYIVVLDGKMMGVDKDAVISLTS